MLLGAVGTATLLQDAGIVLYLICAELLALIGATCESALGQHSRAGTLEAAERRDREQPVRKQLERVGRYVLTARLTRFLGNAMLVVGIAHVLLGQTDVASSAPAVDGLPVATLLLIVLITFAISFLVNDVLVRIIVGKDPDDLLVRALPLLEVLRFAFAPLRVPLVLIARYAFRVQLETAGPSTRQEVLETVGEGEREGSLTKDEAEMIESIMDFESRQVKELMTVRTDMVMLQADEPLPRGVELIVDDGRSRIPVFEKDRDDVVGVLYARDLLSRIQDDKTAPFAAVTVRDAMRSTPFFVPETMAAGRLLAEMRAKQVHMAIVLDEFNGTAGLVTIEDLLEDIVGEIRDEHDDEEDELSPLTLDEGLASGTLDVEGRTSIEEVNQALSVELPIEEDFETMSGLIFHQLGTVPMVGVQLDVEDVRLTVLEADERTVQRVRVETRPD